MTGVTLEALRNRLVTHYEQLKRRLTRRLGNAELAADMLHDTWVRLDGRQDIGVVENADAYLLRMASNSAVDYWRRESRFLSESEIDGLLDLNDPALGPADSAEGRSELEALYRILERMPARRREILLAVRLDGVPQKQLAARYGISLRMVELELQKAQLYCAGRMDRGKG